MIQFQTELCPIYRTVYGNKEFNDFKDRLEQIDHILLASGLETDFIEKALKESSFCNDVIRNSAKRRANFCMRSSQAFRCTIAHHLKGGSFREFAITLADSTLLKTFCRISTIECDRVPSVATLHNYENWVTEEVYSDLITSLLKACSNVESSEKLDLDGIIDLSELFIDSTCVEANIHYPVDLVLLKDATKSLTKSIDIIRSRGIKNRMSTTTKHLMKEMNRLCIKMTHSSRKKDGKKLRKGIFRSMKKLMRTVESHARLHLEKLKEKGSKLFKKKEISTIECKMLNILDQLPKAIEVAHKRIIRGEISANEEKILSLYEKDIHVIRRKKSGKENEFGNLLTLAESRCGLIVHLNFSQEMPKEGDRGELKRGLNKIKEEIGEVVQSVHADRGYDSKSVVKFLEKEEIYNGVCPRSVDSLEDKLQEEKFKEGQNRRSQTEGRIGIFKNVYLDGKLRSKGFENRNQRITQCALVHNLWKLAEMGLAKKAADKEREADLNKIKEAA